MKLIYGLIRSVQILASSSLEDQHEYMDVVDDDYCQVTENKDCIPIYDSDKSDFDSEDNVDIEDDFGFEDPELDFEKQCSTSDHSTLNRYFLDLRFGSFSEKQQKTAYKVFDLIIEKRYTLNIPFVHLSQLAVDFLSVKFDLANDDDDDLLLEKIIEFAKSRPIQNSYISQPSKRIPPQRIDIGSFNYYYVPLIDQLKSLLQNASVLQSIQDEKQMPQVNTFQFYDSELTSSRRSDLLGKARIEFGADDFCIVKAIGPRATQQKYLAFYMTLTNIPVKFRSKRENIRILLIANRHKMKTANVSINDLLKRLRDDLNYAVTHGIDIEVKNNGVSTVVNVQVAFSGFLGDNKGTYEMLGLSESFSLGFVCRACMSNRETIERELDFRLFGTPQDVREYQRKLSRLKNEKNNWGIKRPFIFGNIPGVNIFNCAPFDVLHDLPQGVIPRLFPIILWFSGTKLTFKELLAKIESFQLYHGSVSFNSSKQLKGTAVQVRSIN